MKIFNMDNKIYQTITKTVDLIYLSLLMLLFSIPLVTMGAAFSAGYYTYHKVYYCDDERGITHLFFRSLRGNLRGTIVVSVVSLALCVILYINYQAAAKGLLGYSFLKYVFLLLLVLLITFAIGYFSLTARFENNVRALLISTLSFELLNLPITLLLILIIVAVYFLITIIPITFLLAPAILVMFSHGFCETVFRFYEKPQQEIS